jgi:hypothetical protein
VSEAATLSYADVVGRSWRFSRGDGTVLAAHMRLAPDGRIVGHANPNEHGWRLAAGVVELLDAQGAPTTRLDTMRRDETGALLLQGRFLGASAALHVLAELPTRLTAAGLAPPRVAVMVRTHIITEKLHSLLRRLGGGIGYDLFVCADETRARIEIPGAPVLGHSEAMCGELGLMAALPGHRLLWYFGDYSLYCAYSMIPDYDYYVMIEYDLEFVRGNTLFLEGLLARLGGPGPGAYDFLGTQFARRAPEWQWHAPSAAVFPEVYGILFPLTVLSRRALAYLFDWRQREAAAGAAAPVYCEAFLPSALVADGGFRCDDVNAVLPGAWDFASFRSGAAMLMGNLPALPPAVEIVHPVFSEQEYLRAALEQARRDGGLQAFLSKLAPGGSLAISPKARGEFMKETLRYLSALA